MRALDIEGGPTYPIRSSNIQRVITLIDADPRAREIVRRRKLGESSADHRDSSQRDFEKMGRSGVEEFIVARAMRWTRWPQTRRC